MTQLGKGLGQICCWLLFVWIAVRLVALLGGQLPLIALKDSVGYPDSYVLMTAESFEKTGVIYSPSTPKHPTPAVYSPLLYMSIVGADLLLPSGSHYLGPRLFELICYLSCVFATGLLTRQLIPTRSSLWLGTFMAVSFSSMTFWVYQLRSDYPSIACNLISILLLLRARTQAGGLTGLFPLRLIALAGVCAGLAIQFRFTMGAAAAAGLLWLLLSRQWKASAVFTALAAGIGAGGYVVVSAFEPHMSANIFTLMALLTDGHGALVLMRRTFLEPVMMLGLGVLLSLLPSILRLHRKSLLLMAVFCGGSLVLGGLTSLHFGANINYFYEAMFAVTPFAALGFYKMWKLQRHPLFSFLALLVLIGLLIPNANNTRREVMAAATGIISANNQRHDALRVALTGAQLLSSIPDVAILTPDRYITEPLALHHVTLTQAKELVELKSMIRSHQFDAVVTQIADYSWRGMPVLDLQLKDAISDSYRPACRIGYMLFHLPSGDGGPIAEKLAQAGCRAETCGPGLPCPGLGVRLELFTE